MTIYTIPTSSRPIIINEPDPEALADPEGIALVQAIHDRKAEGAELSVLAKRQR